MSVQGKREGRVGSEKGEERTREPANPAEGLAAANARGQQRRARSPVMG